MQLRVVGVEVFEQLIAEGEVERAGRERELEAVVEHQREIARGGVQARTLRRDFHPADETDPRRQLDAEGAVSRADFEHA